MPGGGGWGGGWGGGGGGGWGGGGGGEWYTEHIESGFETQKSMP